MKAEIEIPDIRILGLLIEAFEGGSNYWCQVHQKNLAVGVVPSRDLVKSGRHHIEGDDFGGPAWYRYPFIPGCHVAICDNEGEELGVNLDREKLQRGLDIMSRDYPNHFADVLSENDDSTTGDVFLQCCLYGKVIFG